MPGLSKIDGDPERKIPVYTDGDQLASVKAGAEKQSLPVGRPLRGFSSPKHGTDPKQIVQRQRLFIPPRNEAIEITKTPARHPHTQKMLKIPTLKRENHALLITSRIYLKIALKISQKSFDKAFLSLIILKKKE